MQLISGAFKARRQFQGWARRMHLKVIESGRKKEKNWLVHHVDLDPAHETISRDQVAWYIEQAAKDFSKKHGVTPAIEKQGNKIRVSFRSPR
ncbi:hypothetical protein HY991_03430 [Candidatus Micrarchaeota archaeon]|nr:hypothetical protein [Candidatus Micrarchaeota archaeon]